MMIPTELIRCINAGTCVALVGSGPSAEMGYPSWKGLAETIAAKLIQDGVADEAAYKRSLDEQQYPALFAAAEYDCGGRRKLIDLLQALLRPKNAAGGKIYSILAGWPFRFYLTTNCDDEIRNHLERIGLHFETLQNGKTELAKVRSSTSHAIVKLHSDLNHLGDVVVTSKDYKRLASDSAGQYFRDKLRSVFQMFDVLIVGHSLRDPNLDSILAAAQEASDPKRPIYLVAADFSSIQVREFYQNYNIVVIPYGNTDGAHHQLRRLLNAADKFIPHRGTRLDLPAPIDAAESEAAASMLIFRRMNSVRRDVQWKTASYLAPLILQALAPTRSVATTEELLNFKPFASILSVSDRVTLTEALDIAFQEMRTGGLIEQSLPYRLSSSGKELSLNIQSERSFERAQAYGQFETALVRGFPEIDASQRSTSLSFVEQMIVEAFRKRGLAIANSIFGDQHASPDDLSELFSAISQAAARLEPVELQVAFTEAAHEFLVSPTEPQKSYLASLSQGFFLYHMLGFDASCTKVRQDVLKKTTWFCDSQRPNSDASSGFTKS